MNSLTEKDEKNIQKELKKQMEEIQQSALAQGAPLWDHDLNVLEECMLNLLRELKVKNKAKYTPKKYRK